MPNRKSKSHAPPPQDNPLRVAHLVSHPIQYLAPIYREISKRHDIDFTVYFYSDYSVGKHFDVDFQTEFEWSTPLLDGYKYRFVPSATGKPIGKPFAWPNWDLLKELIRNKYDAIWINSYIGTNASLVRLFSSITKTPIFFRDDTNLLTPRPYWKQKAKAYLLKPFLAGARAYYVGAANRQYWETYGLTPDRLFFSPHCVDNKYWSAKSLELASQRSEIRRSFGIDDDAPVILFCGKFIPKKQPLKLLSAYSTLRKQMPCWLLFVGDGPLRSELEHQVREYNIPGVIFLGFLNQSALPRAYTAADIFTLPSAYSETWGLVVNEAMHFGLPVIVSNRVGCLEDLVKNGWNGFSFDYRSVDQLVHSLRLLINDAAMRRQFGLDYCRQIANYTVEACAEGIVQGLRAAHAGLT